MRIVIILMVCVLCVLAAIAYFVVSRSFRREYLAAFRMPDAVRQRFCGKRPELSIGQRLQVEQALRQYFQICELASGKLISMPSQVVDDLWHEFILFTRNYENFCKKAFGRYLHHTPVEAMSSPTEATVGIRRAWFHACRLENINPREPKRLPLLFALDAQLGIANGFFYTLNCDRTPTAGRQTFCASHIGSGSGCGGGGSSCGGGCGSGCGGS